MKLIHYTFLVIILFSSKVQASTDKIVNNNNVIIDSALYEFINYIIYEKMPHFRFHRNRISDSNSFEIEQNETDYLTLLKKDTLFNNEDISYFYEQIRISSTFKFSKKLLPRIKLFSYQTYKSNNKDKSIDFYSQIKKKEKFDLGFHGITQLNHTNIRKSTKIRIYS